MLQGIHESSQHLDVNKKSFLEFSQHHHILFFREPHQWRLIMFTFSIFPTEMENFDHARKSITSKSSIWIIKYSLEKMFTFYNADETSRTFQNYVVNVEIRCFF